MKVTSAAVATDKFLFGMCDCTANSDVGTGDFSLVLGNLHVCGHAHGRSHVSQGMDCIPKAKGLTCMQMNFPQARLSLKLLGLPQNLHTFSKPSSGLQPWSRYFSEL